MGLLKMVGKLAVLAAVAVVALMIVGKTRQRAASSPLNAAAVPAKSAAGFVLLSPAHAHVRHVMVMAPPNCPRPQAQRARILAEDLRAAGVPCEVESQISFSFTSEEEGVRVQKFMEGAADPLVLVRGWAKGGPLLADVIAQYHSGL